MMHARWRRMVPTAAILLVAAMSLPAGASHNADQHRKMDLLFSSSNARVNSDLAFWGDHAFVGYYRNDMPVGGFRIFDISNPSQPQQLVDFQCDGLQNDPIIWDRNGNGIADLLLLAVDRTMEAPECGADRSAEHDDPDGWEGVRIFELSDDPADPFADITELDPVYTDCGAHTITAWPELGDNKLMVYVSSYPLRPGPTCGPDNWEASENPTSELHEKISVIEVPLGNPENSEVVAQPEISYPGDPDGHFDIHERGLVPEATPGLFDLVACHDIAVHVRLRLAAGACAEQGQLWEIDENGIPDTENPIWISDDAVSSGGTGDIPGAIDFFHSATFNNDGSVVNWIDESFGDGCPPESNWQPRAWQPGGTQDTGRMFFVDGGSGSFLSEFMIPRPEPDAYCSAHMGLPLASAKKDLLVNAWYMGGVNVVDFGNPSRPKEVAFYDIAPDGNLGSDNWSAYSYVGPNFPTGPGLPIYASDGVHNPDSARGLVVFRANIGKVGMRSVDHLNPQTQE